MDQINAASSTTSIFKFVMKNWYWIIIALVIIPEIVESINIGIKTNNYLYPFFDLAIRLLAADTSIDKTITLLETNPEQLIGIVKPTTEILDWLKYIILFSYNVIYRILGDLSLLFLPLVILYKLFYARDATSQIKNFLHASIWFFIYLFIANILVNIYEVSTGISEINFDNKDKFQAFLTLFIKILPFHGIFHLTLFLIKSIFA